MQCMRRTRFWEGGNGVPDFEKTALVACLAGRGRCAHCEHDDGAGVRSRVALGR